MYEWNETIQEMIDWIEEYLTDQPTLLDMSKHLGYSPYYCSSRFHSITGITLKRYIAGRRLCRAALDIRDTRDRLLDIALKYGFSSQQALTRAFVYAYGCTPAAYRRNPRPIVMAAKKTVLFPEYYLEKGSSIMNKTVLTEARVRIEYIPAHRYIFIKDRTVKDYFAFFEHHNCDQVCGLVESMGHTAHPLVSAHTAGWFWDQGERGYLYGVGVAADYSGEIPEGFEIRDIPGSYYLAFYHPPFDFLKDSDTVVNNVEQLAWNYDPGEKGFTWNEEACFDYQRMMPEDIGYEVLRPVTALR